MPAIENSKLTVVGAGSVGTSIAYASLIRGAARHIALYDIAAAKVEAEVLDLAHGTQFVGATDITGGSDLSVVEGSQVVVITAGAKQRPGQSRLDLAAVNARIVTELMPKLLRAAPDAIYIVVTNPCDVLTVIAQEVSGLPARRVFASGTMLDTSRLRWALGRRVGVSTSSVHASIVGEHGDSEFPLWSSATIGNVPILDWRDASGAITRDELNHIAAHVRDAAYKVIQGKGATNYAVGLSTTRVVEAIFNDQRSVLPVSTLLDDFHGVSGVALSVPCIVDAAGATPIKQTRFDDEEWSLFEASAAEMRRVASDLGRTVSNYPEVVFGKSTRMGLAPSEGAPLAIETTTTATTVAERERRVAEAVHSIEMEGLTVAGDDLQDAQEYIAGRIDSDELVARTRARYGLD